MKRKSYTVISIIIAAIIAGSLAYYGSFLLKSSVNPQKIPIVIIPLGITDPQNIKDGKIQPLPQVIKVVVGENNTIQWKNNDTVYHWIEPDPSNDPSFDAISSGNSGEKMTTSKNAIAPNDSLKFTFTKPGIYVYSVGPGLVGKVIVLEKGETSAKYSSPKPIHTAEVPGASRMTLNSQGNKLYVTSPSSIYIISTLTDILERNATIEKYSYKMAFDNATNNIYLINGESGALYFVNGNSGTVTDQIQLKDTNPVDVAVNYKTGRIYVNYASPTTNGGIFVIDAATKKIIDNIVSPDNGWYQLAVNPDATKIYAIAPPNHEVVVIDGSNDKIIHNIAGIPGTSHGIAIDPVRNRIYINNFDANQGDANILTVVDGNGNKVISNITISEGWKDLQLDPSSIGVPRVAVDTERNVIYATNYLSKSISIIDGESGKVLSKIRLESNPLDVVVDSKTGKLYVSYRDSISVFSNWS
ncbi:MAG: hypothetical protein HRF40_10665 [Nitrososphaera sp.]|jgi:YVTN family beta-propeller protein